METLLKCVEFVNADDGFCESKWATRCWNNNNNKTSRQSTFGVGCFSCRSSYLFVNEIGNVIFGGDASRRRIVLDRTKVNCFGGDKWMECVYIRSGEHFSLENRFVTGIRNEFPEKPSTCAHGAFQVSNTWRPLETCWTNEITCMKRCSLSSTTNYSIILRMWFTWKSPVEFHWMTVATLKHRPKIRKQTVDDTNEKKCIVSIPHWAIIAKIDRNAFPKWVMATNRQTLSPQRHSSSKPSTGFFVNDRPHFKTKCLCACACEWMRPKTVQRVVWARIRIRCDNQWTISVTSIFARMGMDAGPHRRQWRRFARLPAKRRQRPNMWCDSISKQRKQP